MKCGEVALPGPRCVYHLLRNTFHYPAPPGGPCALPTPLSATEALAPWDCLGLLLSHNPRLASHLLLRDALKMDKDAFSLSSRGPLGASPGQHVISWSTMTAAAQPQ